MGALIQMNVGSLLGHFGKPVKDIAHQMLKQRLVHIVASDAHNTGSRRFLLKDAYNTCKDIYPENFVNDIFFTHPKNILNGEDIEPVVIVPDDKSLSIKEIY